MYKSSYCPQTSTKKWNIQVHETIKHLSTNKFDINHMEDKHQQPIQSEEQPTDWDLMEDSIVQIYKLLQRIKNK